MTDSQRCWTPLAIVGASCRLPGSRNLDEFWELVRTGGDATGELPNDVLDRELYYDPEPVKRGKSYSCVGGLIPRVPFDNRKCRLSEAEIRNYDISHLTMCEVASEALCDANYDPFNLPQRNAGVYFGHTGGSAIAGELMYAIGIEQTAQYLHEVEGLRELPKQQRDEIINKIIEETRRDYDFRNKSPQINIAPVTGCELIARAFGLNGPCVVVDAACASSLQALAIGARALVQKTVDMAIVGGASCCKGDSLVLFSAAQSVTTGKSQPFDEAASGLVTAEGYVTLIIKRLEDAVAAGDRIRGVIRGVGMSSDGKGKSLWAPLKDGQTLAIHRAYDDQVRPSDIQFMEAHATSTQVGDATELAALAEAFPAELDNARKIPLGSVKANIGHTLETAGVAGLLKTLLAMEHGIIPPCANLETPNSEIAWEKLPFCLPRKAIAWDRNGTQTRKAAVNAFGIGGLNMHIVLEEYSAQLPVSYYGPVAASSSSNAVREPIAVIGMGAILPGARSVDEFWQLLKSGRDPKTEVTPQRWNAELCYDPSVARPYRSYSKLGGFCTDYQYDWRKHRVPPKQIAAANPLQFMLLDAADQALAQSGYLDKKIDGERVGVIVGTNFGGDFSDDLQMGLKLPDFRRRLSKLLAERSWQQREIDGVCESYETLLLSRKPALVDETGSFTSSTLASRITKTFNLKGGALAMDAGIGTGLAALSAAVDTLRSGDCDMMICAAGQRNMDLQAFEGASVAGVLAKGEATPAFDEAADGYVLGEGCAVVLLKRLCDAKRDNDKVLGVIHDLGVAADWKQEGKAFELATQRVLEGARVAGDAILAVEASGTLRGLEDAEVGPVARLLATPGREHELSFSSIVPQFGYMGATHSLAATIKACLAISHHELPVATPPQQVRRDLFPPGAAAQQSVKDLGNPECSAIGVLGGGDYGTCYHAIIGPEPKPVDGLLAHQVDSSISTTTKVVRYGAATWEQLQQSVRSRSSAEAFGSERSFLPNDSVRMAIVCENEAGLAAIQADLGQATFPLAAEQRDRWGARGVFFGEPQTGRSHCAFIFPGHSSQYPGMFTDAISALSGAALARRQADAALTSLGFQSFEDLAGKQATGLGRDLWKTQAAILVGSWVSYRALTSFGLYPSITLGHSFGEYMALVAAGAWSLTDAIRAARLRAEAIESVPELDGVMAATGADQETIRDVLGSIDGAFVANYNSPQQTVISGHRQAVLAAIQQLKTRRASAVLLTVPAPFHSPILRPAAELLARRLTELPLQKASIPVVSTAGLGEMRDAEQIIESLSKQLVTPVDFPRMLDELLKSRPALIVEVGPKQVLTRLCETNHPQSDVLFMASDNSKRKGALSFFDVVAQADCLGCLDRQPPETLPPAGGKRSKHDARIFLFDATQRRRERLRSQSAQGVPPQTHPPIHRGGADNRTSSNGNGNGYENGNGHRQRERVATVAATAAAEIAQSQPRFAAVGAVGAASMRPSQRSDHEKLTPPAEARSVEVDELRQILVDFVVEQTGYPDDMIEMDADLEADLGIDSIKKAQLFGEVGSRFDIAPREDLSLDDFPTLQHVVDFLVEELGVSASSTATVKETLPAAAIGEAQPVSPVAVVSAGAVEAGVEVEELRRILVDFVVEQTGYPDDMIEMDADLEADLGIDSIKKAQLFGEVGSRFDIAPREDLSLDDFPTLQHVVDFLVQELGVSANSTATAKETLPVVAIGAAKSVSHVAVASAGTVEAGVDVEELRQILVDFVVEQTGYPEDMIEMDADLEADLGIDSIKKAQLFGEVGSKFDIAPREDLSLDDFPTLQHVVDFLVQELGVSATSTATSKETLPTVAIGEAQPVSPVTLGSSGAIESRVDVEELRQILVDFVVEQTGYPEDMIELDADLEADLGIDSIKKAQLFGEVGSRFDIAPREDLSLDDFPTLQHVIDFLVTELGVGELGVGTQSIDAPSEDPPSDSLSEPLARTLPDHVEPQPSHPEFVRVIGLHGNGTDRGKQLGNAFQREIQQNVKWLASVAPGVQTARTDWSGELQEELSGMAGTALVNDDAIFAWNAVDSSRSLRIGFSELTQPSEIPDGVAAAIQVRDAESGMKYLVLGHAGQLAIPFGINSARLTVSSVSATDKPPGLDVATVTQTLHQLLAICSSAEDAKRLLRTLHLKSAWIIGLSDLRSPAPEFLLVSGEGCADIGEGTTRQQEFHEACAGGPSALRVFDRQSKSVQIVSLDDLLPRTTQMRVNPILPAEQHSFQRYVLRMVPAALTMPRTASIPAGECVTVVGDGPVALELHSQLAVEACHVELVSNAAWEVGFREHLDRRRPRHLILTASTNSELDNFQPSRQFTKLLASLQHWISILEQDGTLEGATLVAATSMGGDFCFSSRGPGFAGGALTGLFKGIRREYPALRIKVVDFAPTEPPAAVASSLLNELRSNCTQLEVGYRGDERFVVRAVPSQSERANAGPLPGEVWVVTGGGRGVTAAVAKEIGSAYGLSLHLLGTAPPPNPQAEWRGLDERGLKDLRRRLALQAREQGKTPDQLWRPIEKSMELDRNLQSFQQAGVKAEYHQCDITDRGNLGTVLASIRRGDGPIRGIIHGAGVEAACRFSRKQPEMVEATIASKCDGAANLISLTRQDPLKYFVGFGSTSGRFGGLGQADYSLASDLLAKMVGRLAEERPDCKAVCFHWPAWDEVGMAARPESRMALERGGLSFMSPREGVSHFAAELVSKTSDHAVLILNDPGMLDTDGTMSRAEPPIHPDTFRNGRVVPASVTSTPPRTASIPPIAVLHQDPSYFIQSLRPGSTPDQAYADFLLNAATDPFLIHHSLRGKPILPGVITLQAFSEAALLLRPDEHFIGFSNVSLGNGLSLTSRDIVATTIRMKETADGIHCELIAPFANSRGDIVDRERVYASALVQFGAPVNFPAASPNEPLFGWSQFIYPPHAPIRHGAPLQTFKSLAFRHGAGLSLIESRDPAQLLGERQLRGVALPSAELDGCLVTCGFFVYAMVEQSFNLPYAIERYRLGCQPKPQEQYKMTFTYLGRTKLGHRFDFVLAGESGDILLEVNGYETVAVKE